jgi:hypothetical protein
MGHHTDYLARQIQVLALTGHRKPTGLRMKADSPDTSKTLLWPSFGMGTHGPEQSPLQSVGAKSGLPAVVT